MFIVDDGSRSRRHRDYLDFLEREAGYTVIRRPANGGISRAKNTCLRVIRDSGADLGMIAEDDIVFHEGWDAAYVEAMRQTGMQHFSWYDWTRCHGIPGLCIMRVSSCQPSAFSLKTGNARFLEADG